MASPASFISGKEKIHILKVYEKPLVKASKSFERRATHEKKCAGDCVHWTGFAVTPIAHEFARKTGGKQTIQTKHLDEKLAGFWEARATPDHAVLLIH